MSNQTEWNQCWFVLDHFIYCAKAPSSGFALLFGVFLSMSFYVANPHFFFFFFPPHSSGQGSIFALITFLGQNQAYASTRIFKIIAIFDGGKLQFYQVEVSGGWRMLMFAVVYFGLTLHLYTF